jgi:hypothetical protein
MTRIVAFVKTYDNLCGLILMSTPPIILYRKKANILYVIYTLLFN